MVASITHFSGAAPVFNLTTALCKLPQNPPAQDYKWEQTDGDFSLTAPGIEAPDPSNLGSQIPEILSALKWGDLGLKIPRNQIAQSIKYPDSIGPAYPAVGYLVEMAPYQLIPNGNIVFDTEPLATVFLTADSRHPEQKSSNFILTAAHTFLLRKFTPSTSLAVIFGAVPGSTHSISYQVGTKQIYFQYIDIPFSQSARPVMVPVNGAGADATVVPRYWRTYRVRSWKAHEDLEKIPNSPREWDPNNPNHRPFIIHDIAWIILGDYVQSFGDEPSGTINQEEDFQHPKAPPAGYPPAPGVTYYPNGWFSPRPKNAPAIAPLHLPSTHDADKILSWLDDRCPLGQFAGYGYKDFDTPLESGEDQRQAWAILKQMGFSADGYNFPVIPGARLTVSPSILMPADSGGPLLGPDGFYSNGNPLVMGVHEGSKRKQYFDSDLGFLVSEQYSASVIENWKFVQAGLDQAQSLRQSDWP